MSSGVPSFKVENTDAPIKPEPLDDASSPIASDIDGEGGGYMDDTEVDDPELDLKSARQPLWITRVPHYMWDMLAQAKDDEEIELGTIRVEGTIEKPTRVSLMLNSLPRFAGVEKEYRLDQPVAPLRKKKDKPRTMVFSEKDKAGYKPKTWAWDDLDEDGNPGQGRSYLYEAQRREERKKESKGRYTPYAKRPIPKITSITGTVVQEFDLKPVSNDEHAKFEAKRRETMLAGSIKMASKDSRESLSFIRDSAPRHAATVLTAGEKATMHRVSKLEYFLYRANLSHSNNSKRSRLAKTTARHAWRRTNSLRRYSGVSANFDFTVYVRYGHSLSSPSNGSRRI